MKKYNFNAGPSILFPEVIKQTAEAIVDYNQIGLSILEISHRSPEFQYVLDETKKLLKELLEIPSGYSILFLGGGASLQFCMIPYNLLQTKAAYLDTGTWASKAIKEAKGFGNTVVVASSQQQGYTYIPKQYEIPTDADYLHITSNNTIYGTQIHQDIDSPIPLVADMSSDILSRPVDVSKYGIIYGGVQKNMGPSGAAFVIIKDSLLGKVERHIPSMLNYQIHIEKSSMFNTPPVLPIYAVMQTLKHIKSIGGITTVEKNNIQKANKLYDEIERNKLFVGVAREEDKSLMNVTFVMKKEYQELEKTFLDYTLSQGIVGVKGHRSVGGFRASIYNAMPQQGVDALIESMKQFEKNI